MSRGINLRLSYEEACEIYEKYHHSRAEYSQYLASRYGMHSDQELEMTYDSVYRWLRSDEGAIQYSKYIREHYPNLARHNSRSFQNNIVFYRDAARQIIIGSVDIATACGWRHTYINDPVKFNNRMLQIFRNSEDIRRVKEILHEGFVVNKDGAFLYGQYVKNYREHALREQRNRRMRERRMRERIRREAELRLTDNTRPEIEVETPVQDQAQARAQAQAHILPGAAAEEVAPQNIRTAYVPTPTPTPTPYGAHEADEILTPPPGYADISVQQEAVQERRGFLARAGDFIRGLFGRRRTRVAPISQPAERPRSADEPIAPPPYEFAWEEGVVHNEHDSPPIYSANSLPLTQMVSESNLNLQHLRAFFDAIGEPQYDFYTEQPIEINDGEHIFANRHEIVDGQRVHVLSLHCHNIEGGEMICEIRAYPNNTFSYTVDGQEQELFGDYEIHLERRQHLLDVMHIMATKKNLDLQEILSEQGNTRNL